MSMEKGLFNFATEKEVFILLIKNNTSYISSNRYSLRSNAKCTSDCSTSTANEMNTVPLNNEQKLQKQAVKRVKRVRFDILSSPQATREASKVIDAAKQNNIFLRRDYSSIQNVSVYHKWRGFNFFFLYLHILVIFQSIYRCWRKTKIYTKNFSDS